MVSYQSPKEKRLKKFIREDKVEKIDYNLKALYEQIKLSNFYLIVIAMLLIGIFLRLVF